MESLSTVLKDAVLKAAIIPEALVTANHPSELLPDSQVMTAQLKASLLTAITKGDIQSIIALTPMVDANDLAQNPELEEAYRLALLQISD